MHAFGILTITLPYKYESVVAEFMRQLDTDELSELNQKKNKNSIIKNK